MEENLEKKKTRLDKLQSLCKQISEINRMMSVVDTFCKNSMGSEQIYNLYSIIKVLVESLDNLSFNINQILEDETDLELPEFCKNINLNNQNIEIVD